MFTNARNVNKSDDTRVVLSVRNPSLLSITMAENYAFEVDVDSIIDSLVSPDELAYLQSLGELFSVIDFVFCHVLGVPHALKRIV